MTREEAIQWLKHCAETDCDDCAYEIQPIEWCSEKMSYCVSVLEEALSEPSGDLISREDAIEVLAQVVFDEPPYLDSESLCREFAEDKINEIPSAELTLQTPQTYGKSINPSNAEVVEDYISRADAEPKWNCTANFVAEQLEKLEDMTVSEKIKLIQDLLGVELKEENLNYEHATLVDIKEPLKVEVVRCKDCKWWQDNNNGYPHTNCHWCETETPDEDDFCSLGERREP